LDLKAQDMSEPKLLRQPTDSSLRLKNTPGTGHAGHKRACFPVFSIIIPTRNEEDDIKRCLDSVTRLSYPHKEVLVVDASTDRTREIVEGYSPAVTYVRQTGEPGRCAARNQGIMTARGDIVVILNADVVLPVDFLERTIPHYAAGTDYLLVEAEVANQHHLFGRYVHAKHVKSYSRDEAIEWTEGFSCRRQAAIDVGMFPSNLPVPMCAGEDGAFALALKERYRKGIDRTIVVQHVVPHRLPERWGQIVGRGQGMVQVWYFEGKSAYRIWRSVLKGTIAILVQTTTVAPVLQYAGTLCTVSPRGYTDLPGFIFGRLLELAGELIGLWRGSLQMHLLRGQVSRQ
jgi:cellulose synthase/poly-beta-1,6-N-acetylglucosamine synthase-like glycosyltransferase